MDQRVDDCVAAIRANHVGEIPKIAMQLGSGLNSIAEALSDATVISYADIPGFPQPSVEGHAGHLLIGKLDGVPILCLQGRVHYYEGQGLDPAVVMIRTLKGLGVETLILTNAAGSLDEDMGPGSLMVISDHINFSGGNPLFGINDLDYGPRFPDMTNAWDPELRDHLHAASAEVGEALFEGVYMMATGPSFETPAEIRAFRTWGANAVGMSTVPECIVARHAGMRVVGISSVTNFAAGMMGTPISHEETIEEGGKASFALSKVLVAFLKRLI